MPKCSMCSLIVNHCAYFFAPFPIGFNFTPAIGSVTLVVSVSAGIPDSIPLDPQPDRSTDTVNNTNQDIPLRIFFILPRIRPSQ